MPSEISVGTLWSRIFTVFLPKTTQIFGEWLRMKRANFSPYFQQISFLIVMNFALLSHFINNLTTSFSLSSTSFRLWFLSMYSTSIMKLRKKGEIDDSYKTNRTYVHGISEKLMREVETAKFLLQILRICISDR